MAVPPVVIVTLTSCGHCAEAQAFFRQRGIVPTVIAFDKVGVALRRRIAADMRAQHVDGFPFVMIGGKAVNGWRESSKPKGGTWNTSSCGRRGSRTARATTSAGFAAPACATSTTTTAQSLRP